MKKAYADIPEGQVHYQTDGSGENLLLLHQTPLSSDEYADMMPFLAKGCRVIAMDTLGHGSSDNPPREYELEDFARNVISFLDAIGVGKASIVGHHTGAVIAVEVAAAYPERVDKLVLSGLPVIGLAEWQAFLSQPMSRDFPMTEDGQFLTMTWEKYLSLSPGYSPELWFKPFIIALKARTRPYDVHYAVGRYDVKAHLGSIQSPTLLVSGSGDMFIDQLESTRSMIPRCVTRVIEGGDLFVCFEKPQEFAQAILDFMKSPGV